MYKTWRPLLSFVNSYDFLSLKGRNVSKNILISYIDNIYQSSLNVCEDDS